MFNTDQGSQFTSPGFTGVLKEAGVKISMDGKGRWMDNVFIERLGGFQVRVCVSQRVCDGQRGKKGSRRMDRILQRSPPAFDVRWANA